jgi:putative ABC transport system ATP-binding protein
MSPVLEARTVTKSYVDHDVAVDAVRGVDLCVEPGELVAVMGPSGCGKSTLLHLLGGLARPTSGAVLVDGVDLSAMDDDALAQMRRERIGFVFQAFNLVPVLSVGENVQLPAAIAGVAAGPARARGEELLDLVGLTDRRDKRPAQLSGGEQQRVAIARALMLRPAAILADEPTGNLDSVSGRRIVGLLQELNRQGQTVVIVTHDVKVAGVADRLLQMRDGRLDEHHGVESEGFRPAAIERLIEAE